MSVKKMLACAAALAVASVAFAVAGQGLKWSASVTYEDGTAIESTQKVVYLIYSQDGKQIGSTFSLGVAASALPADGCYYVKSALYSVDINGVIPASDGKPTPTVCTKTAPPVQKRVAPPGSFIAQ